MDDLARRDKEFGGEVDDRLQRADDLDEQAQRSRSICRPAVDAEVTIGGRV